MPDVDVHEQAAFHGLLQRMLEIGDEILRNSLQESDSLITLQLIDDRNGTFERLQKIAVDPSTVERCGSLINAVLEQNDHLDEQLRLSLGLMQDRIVNLEQGLRFHKMYDSFNQSPRTGGAIDERR